MLRLLHIVFAICIAIMLASRGVSVCVLSAAPVGAPVLDPPTLRSLGVYWIVRDSDANPARVTLDYRKSGDAQWQPGPALLRTEPGPFKDEGGQPKPPAVVIPPGARLFAGSALLLAPDTAYDLRLTLLHPPDKPLVETLHAHTIAEPQAPANLVALYVKPGNGGGSGTKDDPFRGLAAAGSAARPGNLLLLQAGVYDAPFYVNHSGEPGKPIVWRGGGDGEAIIDAHKPLDHLTDAAIEATGLHDVWFEHLSMRNAHNGIRAHESNRLVVRRCKISNVICGVVATKDDTGALGQFFISDNEITGLMPWPATEQQWHDLPESRGIWITGRGSVACYNRITSFKDGMDLDDCSACVGNDFHNNDVSRMFDDGSEMDGSNRNCRNFYNRYTNVLCGISFQPVYGGPVYAFRNVIYNIRNEPFKLHNSPSGAVIVNNTCLRNGDPLKVSTSDSYSNCYSRNNLLVGTEGRAYDCTPAAIGCDYDYDGFAGWSGPVFFKWNNEKYSTPEEVRSKCPVERHIRVFNPEDLFMGGTLPPKSELTVFDGARLDLRLKPGSPAIKAGEALNGFFEGGKGSPADLGAYPAGAEIPQYGPRK